MNDLLSPERVIDRLVTQDIFADLDPVSLRVIALAGETLYLQPGEILFREGDAADSAYFVLQGSFGLNHAGSQEVSTRNGDLLHPLCLIADLSRPTTATAQSFCEVLKIPRSVFRRILDSAPALAIRLRDKLARDLIQRMGEIKPLQA